MIDGIAPVLSMLRVLVVAALAIFQYPACVIGFGWQRHCLDGQQTTLGRRELRGVVVVADQNPIVGLLLAKKTKQEIEKLENQTRGKRTANTSSIPPLHWIDAADAFIYAVENESGDVQHATTSTAPTPRPNRIQFTVRGQPLALKRHRSSKGFIYNPSAKAQQSFSTAVGGLLADHAAPLFPLDDYLTVSMVFYLPRPRNHYVGNKVEPERLRPTAPLYTKTLPDVDNLAKFVLDSLNGLLFHDDRQVASLTVTKIYGDVPATRVTVQKLCPQGYDDSGFPPVVE